MKDAKKAKDLEDKINAENAEKAQQLEAYKAMVAAKEAELVIARNFRDEAIARGLYQQDQEGNLNVTPIGQEATEAAQAQNVAAEQQFAVQQSAFDPNQIQQNDQ